MVTQHADLWHDSLHDTDQTEVLQTASYEHVNNWHYNLKRHLRIILHILPISLYMCKEIGVCLTHTHTAANMQRVLTH